MPYDIAHGWTLSHAAVEVGDRKALLAALDTDDAWARARGNRRLAASLDALALDQRLIFWGVSAGKDEPTPITPTLVPYLSKHWNSDRLSGLGRSYDGVRVFPFLHSPDAVDRLEGLALQRVIECFVLDDPQFLLASTWNSEKATAVRERRALALARLLERRGDASALARMREIVGEEGGAQLRSDVIRPLIVAEGSGGSSSGKALPAPLAREAVVTNQADIAGFSSPSIFPRHQALDRAFARALRGQGFRSKGELTEFLQSEMTIPDPDMPGQLRAPDKDTVHNFLERHLPEATEAVTRKPAGGKV